MTARQDGLREPETTLEFERKFLLDLLPNMPTGAEIWRIDQGYLSDDPNAADGITRGRLRRVVLPDKRESFFHTVKSGAGRVRREVERSITAEQFARHWPRTEGRRLSKTRYRISERGLVWEIDDFDGLDLAMLEIELPAPDHEFEVPKWLQAHVVREVTDDPKFSNFSIASRSARHY